MDMLQGCLMGKGVALHIEMLMHKRAVMLH